MIDQETRRKLRIIGIPEAIEAIDMIEDDASYASLTFDEKLRTIVDFVTQEKENKSVKRHLSHAHLRDKNADIAQVIYDGRPLSRDMIASLGTCKFTDTAKDIIIVGYTGTGKTYLANALGKQACKNCMSTLYIRMPDLLMAREEDLAAGKPESKILAKYAKYKVLVMDEWLIDPLKKDQMRFFLELVDRRYDVSSTIWCSQYPVSDWHRRLGGGTHGDAILDRIVHNAIVIETGDTNMRELTSITS